MVTAQCDAPGKGDPLLDTDGDGDHDNGDEANNRESASYAVSSLVPCLAVWPDKESQGETRQLKVRRPAPGVSCVTPLHPHRSPV